MESDSKMAASPELAVKIDGIPGGQIPRPVGRGRVEWSGARGVLAWWKCGKVKMWKCGNAGRCHPYVCRRCHFLTSPSPSFETDK